MSQFEGSNESRGKRKLVDVAAMMAENIPTVAPLRYFRDHGPARRHRRRHAFVGSPSLRRRIKI